jgi:FkbM family methyltransferase
MQKSLLGGDNVIENGWKPEPFYHDLYNDLFYKDIIFENKKTGYFVEVGALDGMMMSQSFLFEKLLNWKGIVVEPNPVWKDSLHLHRTCNISNAAISNENGKATFESREIPAYSGLKSSVNESRTSDIIGEFDVETLTLSSLFDKFNAPETIDWVSIDTEGAELDILTQYFLENSKYKINLLNFEAFDFVSTNKLMDSQPYLKIKNPYLDFLKMSNKGLLKFNTLTGEMYSSPYTEWRYDGNLLSGNIQNITFEHYYIHIDYLKDNLHLKQLLIN